MKYRVAWTVHKYEEIEIEADSPKEAKDKWDDMNIDGDLFFIEDENGKQIIYDTV